jgi:hypothetical protein
MQSGALNQGRKSSLLGNFETGHPLDNLPKDGHHDYSKDPLTGQALYGSEPVMGGKGGVLNDGGKVQFGGSRQKCLERFQEKQPESIYSFAVKGDEDEVYKRLCMEKEGGVDSRNPFNGRTVLHEAAANNHLSLASMLLEQFGANIDSRTYLGKETPLHLAVAQNLRPMVYLLLNLGADPNICSK